MNGATTEPWARISSPPMSTVTMMIGSSQNLRRAPRNLHIWRTKSIAALSLEQVLEAVFRRPGRIAPLPVRRRRRLVAPGERVAAREPHEEGDRREDAEEDDAHHHRAHDSVEELAELHPAVL